jgi:type 1 glutamine amidotransferase
MRWLILLSSIFVLGGPCGSQEAKPLAGKQIVMVSGSVEYKSDESLPGLAKLLEEKLGCTCTIIRRKTDDQLEDLAPLQKADAVIFFTRRLTVDGEQLAAIKKFLESGKPVLGLRTASHGFQKYLAMDKEVFGGDYQNHFKAGTKTAVKLVAGQATHAILKGVEAFESEGTLYKNPTPANDITVLLQGETPKQATQPIAWTRLRGRQKIFYTSLGHPDDFKQLSFQRLMMNAVQWCLATD